MDMRSSLGRRGLWLGEVVAIRATLFFFFFDVHRLAVSLYYVKQTSQAGQGHGEQDGDGDSRQKRLQKPGALSNETLCYPRYPCAGVAQVGEGACACGQRQRRVTRRS